MEGQVQMSPNPQVPAKQNRPQVFILALFALLLLSIAYYGYLYMQQSKQAQEILQVFTQYLEHGEYTEAHEILSDIESKGLGSHLQETRSALNKALGLEFEKISLSILNEKEKNFAVYQKAKDLQFFWKDSSSKTVLEDQIKKTTEQ